MKNKIAKVSELPNLHEAETAQHDLVSEYWTPEEVGEYKVGVIVDIKEESYTSEQTGETVMLPCIIMLSQEKNGTFNTIRNGSKRLVGAVEDAEEKGELVFGQTPVKVTYTGKKRNKTNSNQSDRWSVRPLIIN